MIYMIMITFFFSLMCMFKVRKHFLLTLINLEFIFLTLFSLIFFYLNFFGFEFYFSLVFLILSVCEASMGLSILVYLVRKTGLDYADSLNLC
uniref:NADH-ubiquinone oxidoreductase chain 4L n=1 Tax=Epeurysa nawaii TaxID=1308479 RepID=A0A7S4YYQ4_9HEMI|nr:NADH dehydrogenase subunit 4L [Epeurysa nawaii]QBZ38000.1 NADH dehydrogenase subunit 4L [Epeurysa nawaii]QBZ38013.1 NADH dehydrogenase subunit 4L [Epeurysa nawaii]